MKRWVLAILSLAALLTVPDIFPGPPAAAAPIPAATQPDEGSGEGKLVVAGSWRGAKLKCKKEAGKAVRCGRPEPFDVVFNEDGSGTSADERFPHSFTYRWSSPLEIVITPVPEGEELKLFQFELDDGFLTFQAYIYLPQVDGDGPAEVNYVHYIFDISLTE